jgi:hypothetical protein
MALRISALAVVAFVGSVGACSSRDLGPGSANGGAGGQAGGGQTGGTTMGGTGGRSNLDGVGGSQMNCQSGGGATGRSAEGGSLGSGGGSGTDCCRSPSSCIEGLCGNGVVDTCTAPSGPGSCPVVTFAEPCDGDDLDGQSCASFGYGSGALVCSNACSFDTTGCYSCAVGSPAVARCNVVPSKVFGPPAMAATDTETALVWLDQPDGDAVQIGFALLSSSLDVIATRQIVDAAIAAPAPTGAPTAQIAALPSGWLVLATTGSSLSLYTLDGAGTVVAHSALDPMSGGFEISSPILVSQPNGGPLVIWQVFNTYAAVVSADGRSVTTPLEVPVDSYAGGGVLPSLTSAAFAAGEFQAVFNENCVAGPCLEIVSIALDGTVAGSFKPPGVAAPWGASLVTGADDLRLLYEADCGTTLTNPCLMWQRMSSTGAVLSSQVLINGSSTSGLPSSAVALGADGYVLGGQPASSMLLHLSSDGAIAAGPSLIATVGSAVMVRQGSGLIAGWAGNGIEVAQLRP